MVLRAFESGDQDLVTSVVSDALIPLITTVPPDGDAEDVAAYIARQRGRLQEGAGYSFAIADATSGKGVGQIGLWTREAHLGRATMGYWVAPQFRRRGYARDALATVTTWASSFTVLHRLQLFVEPWNTGSWRAAEACGFEREGLLRGWELVGDRYKDMYVYSRLTSA
ncbi:GNAT family N-acetyltransferase [Cellulomonas soli]|uniref:GNAT family N-acetyltransferase n=1 Tax=Cellulomonas soli TaxID=931535 RepID=UPI00178E1B40|nr:GNAT family protein [Cellulomonas soli]NYI57448.1 RimJ/RimL family protein N-acetyltransferase [Cellulomonas soli]